MSRTLLDLSGKINPELVEIYKTVAQVADGLGIPFFVVGATARDMVLELGYGISPSRATHDIDLGVKVADWQQFNALKEGLIATGSFRSCESAQRIFHVTGWPMDIVPFGQISGPESSIAWPPRQEVEMNVMGFDEAHTHSMLVKLESNPDFLVRFASPAGWALLKIIAWAARTDGAQVKDALDLLLILKNYAEAGNSDRLYESEQELLIEEGHDLEYAGARLLGRDITGIAKQESRNKVLEILKQEISDDSRFALATNMIRNRVLAREEFEKNLTLIKKLCQGVEEASPANS